jgi:DNA mismatch repair protein MutS
VERLISKIASKKTSPREVLQIAKGLQQTAIIKKQLDDCTNKYLQRLADGLNTCSVITDKILTELKDSPPITAQKGDLIQSGINKELDELRSIASGGKSYLLNLQQKEADATCITSLKIGFNNVFGYYLEVTNEHKNKVPNHWIRKQTLTNAERYITPELKEYEEKIVGAEEKMLALETQLFDALLNALQDYIAPIQVNGTTLAIIDCLICFAEKALKYHYHQPIIHDGLTLQLLDCRHPVIERNLPAGETYIPTDITLDPDNQQIIILTGPNMSGKSAILRQTALITLMAHMGRFVPATEASIPLTDKIFTRVGASDNLSGGESTFMVEMNKIASIINNLSERSLVLLDEIGRGTSTYDGISIAWSMVEYLHNSVYKPKTLFATHYHELNALEHHLPGVKNFHITNRETGNKEIFLRKLAPGGSTHSFGIHVAKMAGMPPELIARANEILQQLEGKELLQETQNYQNNPLPTFRSGKPKPTTQLQLSIYDAHTETFEGIRKMLENIDINRLTPVEALMKLNEIKNMLH